MSLQESVFVFAFHSNYTEGKKMADGNEARLAVYNNEGKQTS